MRRHGLVLGAIAILLSGAPQASASTIGVPNLAPIPISGAGIIGPGPVPPYDTRVSGNLDGSTGHYASEAGFLTDVSVSHYNDSPVTVKILVLARGTNDNLNVVQAPMTMVLPAAPSNAPLITTQTVPAPTSIAVGDRIGLSYISGTATLHALVANSSMIAVPGGFPSPLPGTEPSVGNVFNMTDSISGPLISGTVSANANPPTDPEQLAPRSKPLAAPTTLGAGKPGVMKIVKKKVKVSVGCQGLGIRVTCSGQAEVEIEVGEAAAAASLGSVSYSIPTGTTQAVTVPLSKAGLKKVAKKGKLSATFVLTEDFGSGPVSSRFPIILKGKKAKRKK